MLQNTETEDQLRSLGLLDILPYVKNQADRQDSLALIERLYLVKSEQALDSKGPHNYDAVVPLTATHHRYHFSAPFDLHGLVNDICKRYSLPDSDLIRSHLAKVGAFAAVARMSPLFISISDMARARGARQRRTMGNVFAIHACAGTVLRHLQGSIGLLKASFHDKQLNNLGTSQDEMAIQKRLLYLLRHGPIQKSITLLTEFAYQVTWLRC